MFQKKNRKKRAKLWGPRAHFGANISMKIADILQHHHSGFPAKWLLKSEHRNSFKETGNYSSRHSIFFFLLQTRLERTLTRKGSLESVVFHVPVFFLFVRMALSGGRFVRLVGKYAVRLSRMENAVLSSCRNWFQSGREVWTSNFIAHDDTLLNVKFC